MRKPTMRKSDNFLHMPSNLENNVESSQLIEDNREMNQKIEGINVQNIENSNRLVINAPINK